MNLENEKYAEYIIEDQVTNEKIYYYNETEFAVGFAATGTNTWDTLDENEIEYDCFIYSELIDGFYKHLGLHQCNDTDLKYFHPNVVEEFSWGSKGRRGFYNYQCLDDPKEIIMSSRQDYMDTLSLFIKVIYKNTTKDSV